MAVYSLTGNDVIFVNGVDITKDLADGDSAAITIPNDLVEIAVGKNGNAIYALNENGRRYELEVRVLRGSESDKTLLGWYAAARSNFAQQTLLTAEITKSFGDGMGTETQTYTYFLKGGMIRKAPEMKINVNGDTEQSVTVYNIVGVVENITIG